MTTDSEITDAADLSIEDATVCFGSLEEWANQIGVPAPRLRERLQRISPLRARDVDGKPIDVYSEVDIRQVFPEAFPDPMPWRKR